ncbi:MAG: YvcK family protein [Candidatus Levybacteria bacterium]|nr:YvcK family protein [Candidatus Levybacteria bacterium]
MKIKGKKIVCLGGGIGTVNLIKGLNKYSKDIGIVLSMADDGGSAGRLRRLYNILPPGDLISCMSGLIKDKNPVLSKLLTYRFPGDRYGKDNDLAGQKLGSLILVAARDISGSFEKAIELFQKIFDIPGNYLPATLEQVSISIKTKKGEIVEREEVIDLGEFNWKNGIDKLYLTPENIKANPKALSVIKSADVIIAGPGDLYTTLLPVLIVPEISNLIKKSKALKIFIVNVANKHFETNNYTLESYIEAVKKHLDVFPFDIVIGNNNQLKHLEYTNYSYVPYNNISHKGDFKIILEDVIDLDFPIYHSSEKLAKVVAENI